MGMHSTLFGPVKYAYLPQQLKPEELVGGNGVIEMGTFVGILLGEMLGALLVLHQALGHRAGGRRARIAIAVLGWLASRAHPAVAGGRPDLHINWNPLTESIRNIGFRAQNRAVFLSMLGNSWFWFYGAMCSRNFRCTPRITCSGDQSVFVLLLTRVFARHRRRLAAVRAALRPQGRDRPGAVRLDRPVAVRHRPVLRQPRLCATRHRSAVVAFLRSRARWRILFDCVLIGVFGGFYIVPLFALIQTRCDAGASVAHRSPARIS